MSAPKQIAKRQKLERKRRRKQEAQRRRSVKRSTEWTEWVDDEFGEDFVATSGVERSAGPPSRGLLGTALDFVTGRGGSRALKMSDVLQDFVKPYIDMVEDEDSMRKLLSLGIIAWNAALSPEAQQEPMVDDLLRNRFSPLTGQAYQELRTIVDELIGRKLSHFAQIRRPIIDFILSDFDGESWYLQVISALV
jgi:hypothetical protein